MSALGLFMIYLFFICITCLAWRYGNEEMHQEWRLL
jgi:cbb3-type cytochrome oxidase subunit 3